MKREWKHNAPADAREMKKLRTTTMHTRVVVLLSMGHHHVTERNFEIEITLSVIIHFSIQNEMDNDSVGLLRILYGECHLNWMPRAYFHCQNVKCDGRRRSRDGRHSKFISVKMCTSRNGRPQIFVSSFLLPSIHALEFVRNTILYDSALTHLHAQHTNANYLWWQFSLTLSAVSRTIPFGRGIFLRIEPNTAINIELTNTIYLLAATPPHRLHTWYIHTRDDTIWCFRFCVMTPFAINFKQNSNCGLWLQYQH